MGDWYEELPSDDLYCDGIAWSEIEQRISELSAEDKARISRGNLFSGKGRPETPSPSPMRPFAGFEVLDFGLGPSPVPTDYYAEIT